MINWNAELMAHPNEKLHHLCYFESRCNDIQFVYRAAQIHKTCNDIIEPDVVQAIDIQRIEKVKLI